MIGGLQFIKNNTGKCKNCPHHSEGVCFYNTPKPIEDLDECPDDFIQVWKISAWLSKKKEIPSELVGEKIRTTDRAILVELKNFEDKKEIWIPKSQIIDTYKKKKI